MIKIIITVRNRLAITKKCIHAIKSHSTIPHQIYVYDNSTNYLLEEHFTYFMKLYRKKYISQVTFSHDDATFNAFSKAVSSNIFGSQHEFDPQKNNYDFLLLLDNDIIVTPGYDRKLKEAWTYVNKNKITNIKIIGQLPGGIKRTDKTPIKISNEIEGFCGHLGGSGLWSFRPNFFTEVGYLDLRPLVNQTKRHDQSYWQILSKKNSGKPYIMGLNQKLGIHCGSIAGSVCNKLMKTPVARRGENLEVIHFEDAEKKIDSMSFDEFYKSIENDKRLMGDW